MASKISSTKIQGMQNGTKFSEIEKRFLNVESKKYGQYGTKISIDTKGSLRGGSRGDGKRGYNAKIAANIFIMSEMGYRGRKPFTLPMRKIRRSGNFESRYRVSHNSGQWRIGTTFVGPLAIPGIGPFYFSSKSNDETL